MKEFIRNLVGRKQPGRQEKIEPQGMEKYKSEIEALALEFEKSFDSNDRTKTEDIYQRLKRAQTMFHFPLMEMIYSGILLEPAKYVPTGEEEGMRKQIQESDRVFMVQTGEFLGGIIADIDKVISSQALNRSKATILPLEGGHEAGVSMNDSPAIKKYQREVGDIRKKAGLALSPLVNMSEASVLIRPEDLEYLASVRRTLDEDKKMWQALAEEWRPENKRITSGFALYDIQNIDHTIIQLVQKHERAFSKDGLSQADKGAAFLMGFPIEAKNVRALMDEGDVNIESVPDSFSDSLNYFGMLGISPADLVGKKEEEIKTALKRKYYPLVKQCHPDLYPGDNAKEERFKKVSEAFEVLADPKRRSRYLNGSLN